MNKRESIYRKIRRQTLIVAIVSVMLVCAIAFGCIAYMRDSLVNVSESLGNAAAADSVSALEFQMEESLLRLAKNKAVISDEKLMAVSSYVDMIAESASEIMSDPARHNDSQVTFPDPVNDGIAVAQLRLGEGVSYDEVRDEIELIGNIQELLKVIHNNSKYIRSAYIGTENGVSISFDVDSARKTNIYEPRQRPWYLAAKEQGKLIWTDVFSDNSGRGLAITCARPYYSKAGELLGVAAVGMTLESIEEIVVGTTVGSTGYAFMINDKGEMIFSDMLEVGADGNVVTVNLFDGELIPYETVERMTGRQSGIERVTINGTDCFIAYEPLQALPWSLAVVMNVDEVIAPAMESEGRIMAMKTGSIIQIDKAILMISLTFGLILVAIVCAVIGQTKKLAGRLAGPIIDLSKGAEIIGSGNLEHRLDVNTGDEIESLAVAFNTMINNIKLITAEKERIGAELNVATQIQASMLPCIFPPYPDRSEFDIYASMLPAKEVGGDFYDFFLTDDDHLCVVVADVSGKGVPAALFMVIAKTLIKNSAQSGKSPEDVFEIVNNQLCEGNQAGMFVTAFMGILQISTGKFTYVNAGHNPPLVRIAGKDFDWLPTKPGFVLAGMEDMCYKQNEITLLAGDVLYLYTDGVTEAVNRDLELFSDPRLLRIANQYKDCSLKDQLTSIKKEIDSFADGAEQADDITMLALKITGGAKMKELIIDATIENLNAVMDFVNDELMAGGCGMKTQTQIGIVVEEIFVNIAHYAYNPDVGGATIRVSVDRDVIIEFEDKGTPYNPLLKEDPDVTAKVEEREIGGLGIFMVKQIMDSVEYKHEAGKNILIIRKANNPDAK